MNCTCTFKEDCAVFGCLLSHPLLTDWQRKHLALLAPSTPRKARLRQLIDMLQEHRPPKVSGKQVDRYYAALRYHGVNIDREPDKIGKAWLNKHNAMLHPARVKNIISKRVKDKKPLLKPEQKQAPAPVKDLEYQNYLSTQTLEQFRLAQKYGWIVAKALTEPQENFHIENDN